MWFCSHDAKHTKTVTRQVKDPPESPISWLIAKGTTITQAENTSLEGAGFILQYSYSSTYTCSEDLNALATSSSRPKKWRPGVSKEAKKRLENASLMQAQLVEDCIVKHNQHVVFKIVTQDTYDVHIKEEPMCTCPDF